MHRYSYVNNNPLTFTDPSGFDGEDGGDSDEFSGGQVTGNGPLAPVGGPLAPVGDIIPIIDPSVYDASVATTLEQIEVDGHPLPASSPSFFTPSSAAADITANTPQGAQFSADDLNEITVTARRINLVPQQPSTQPTPTSQHCFRGNNPNVQSNVNLGIGVGAVGGALVGAVIIANIIGFPEVEVAEVVGGGAAAVGGGAVYSADVGAGALLQAISEPGSTLAVGAVAGAGPGFLLGGIFGYGVPATSAPGCN